VTEEPLAEDDLAYVVVVSFEVPGPGIDVVAAELLLDVLTRFGHQGLSPITVKLDVTVASPHP